MLTKCKAGNYINLSTTHAFQTEYRWRVISRSAAELLVILVITIYDCCSCVSVAYFKCGHCFPLSCKSIVCRRGHKLPMLLCGGCVHTFRRLHTSLLVVVACISSSLHPSQNLLSGLRHGERDATLGNVEQPMKLNSLEVNN